MKKAFTKILSGCLAAVMAFSLTACQGNSGGASGSETQASTSDTVSTEPVQVTELPEATGIVKDSLNIGTTALWATLSPFQTTNNQYGPFVKTLYDRLAVVYDGEYVPQMAESWEVADDGVTWTVKIHDNITDSEGTLITADDIVWFIQESMDRKLKPQFNKIAEVSKVDDYTFNVVMKEPVVGTFELVLAAVYGVSEEAFKASSDEFASTVVSSGPYKVVEFVPGSHLTLELRDDYWNKDADNPALQNNVKNLTYTVITEASQQQIALETGSVDCFESLTASLVSAFDGSPDYDMVTAPSGNGYQMYFSGSSDRFCGRSEDLCKAIAHCIDIDGVIAAAYDGLATPMHSGASEMLIGYNEAWTSEPYFEYDVEKAQEYLKNAGYNGEELVLMSSNEGGMDRLTQLLQGYMAAIGINCKIELLDNALFSASRFDGSQYDMILVSAGGVTITNWWGNRFDMNAYEMGDGTGRRDETLTNMIYDAWTTENYNEERIDDINDYLNEHCYVYGLVNPTVCCVYRTDSGIMGAPVTCQGAADFSAAVFQ